MAGSDTIDRLQCCVGQRVGAVDDRCDLAGFHESLERDQVVVVLRLDGWFGLLAHEHGREHRPHGAAELAVGVPAAVRDQSPAWRERAPGPCHRMVPDVVEDQVITFRAAGEVLARVVDDVVGTDRAKKVRVLRTGHAGHGSTHGLGDLHGEGAHAARCAVDEDLLPG